VGKGTLVTGNSSSETRRDKELCLAQGVVAENALPLRDRPRRRGKDDHDQSGRYGLATGFLAGFRVAIFCVDIIFLQGRQTPTPVGNLEETAGRDGVVFFTAT